MGLTRTSIPGVIARLMLPVALTAVPAADAFAASAPVRELHYREVLYHHYRQDHFRALTTLLAGQERDVVAREDADADLLRIGIELSYGMHESAMSGFDGLLRERIAPRSRDRIWLSLARTWIRRGYADRAAYALGQIGADADAAIRAERAVHAALLAAEQGDGQAAIAELDGIGGASVWSAYARYNRMMLTDGFGAGEDGAPAMPLPEDSDDEELRNLRDLADTALGYRLLERQRPADAAAAFARIDPGSLAAGRARLGAGWAAFDSGDIDRAAALWSALADEGMPAEAAREARLLSAGAQRHLGAHDAAIAGYRGAIDELDREYAGLGRAIAVADADDSFLTAIGAGSREQAERGGLPRLYRSPHLHGLAARDDFHETWSAWRQLRFLRERLAAWAEDAAAFESMLATRRRGYEQRLPEARDRLATLDTDALRERVAGFARRVDEIEASGAATALATPDERRLAGILAGIGTRLAPHAGDDRFAAHRDRLRVLQGVLQWNLEYDFRARLWETRKGVLALDAALARVEEGRARLEQARLAAPARFTGFDERIADARTRIAALTRRVTTAVAGHEARIKGLVIAELERQRGRIAAEGARARYELAGLLDERAAESAGGEWQAVLRAWLDFAAVAGDDTRRLHALRRIADLRLMLADGLIADDPARDGELRAAIVTYEELLRACPACPGNDGIHYQLARAHDSLGDPDSSLDALTRLVGQYPDSPLRAEAQFRRGEALFVERRYREAEQAYAAVFAAGADSAFDLQARFKRGWSLFKQTRYEEAIDDFIAVLDRHLAPDADGVVPDPDTLPDAGRALVADTLRVIGLGFSHLDGPEAADAYFAGRPPVAHEYLVFAGLTGHYLEKERYSDAARTLAVFIERNPGHAEAAASQIRIIDIHDRAGFVAPALQARRELLDRFGIDSPYWERHDIAQSPEIAERLRHELLTMAENAHGLAQAGGSADDYREAARRYRDYLAWFPADPQAPRLGFLLGELLFETGDHAGAIFRYEQSAYHYGPHEQAAEAGYAALLAYDRHIAGLEDAGQRSAWQEQAVTSALLFADHFPEHDETPAVLARAAEQLFRAGRPDDAHAVALRVVADGGAAAPALQLSAWTLIGQTQFDRARYAEAEHAYTQAIALAPRDDPARASLVERQAAAVYQQGRIALDRGVPLDAARQFLRVAQVAPATSIVETAEYDAASALLAGGSTVDAIAVLERFRGDWPDSRWIEDVTRKLYFAFLADDRPARAADELVRLETHSSDPEEARAAVWQSAELYSSAGMTAQALRRYRHYLSRWPQPLDPAMEARRRLADGYLALGDDERRRHWLNEIVAADARAGAARSDFSRESAAGAALALAEPLRRQFEAVKLVIPLDRSLAAKRAAMDRVLKAYRAAAEYGVADVTTAATFHTGEIYHELSRALLASQRPAELSAAELEQYDILLEEQAYPFEEEAIRLHEVNYRRIADGIYDDWVKRSLEQLGALLPARYGKAEILVSLVESVH